MARKITHGRRFYPRVFPGFSGPNAIEESVVLTTPMEGFGRYHDLRITSNSVTAGTAVLLGVVPDDEQWWIPYMMAHHDDSGLTSHLWIHLRNPASNEVAVVGSPDVTEKRRVSIRRPLIVPEGWRVGATLASVPAAGKKLFLSCYYVMTPMGEYVPAT